MPKNMQTSRSAGAVSKNRSNNQPIKAPPAGPAISSVKTRFPCRIPLAGGTSCPVRSASAFRTIFSCMSNESSRGSLLPLPSCAGVFGNHANPPDLTRENRHETGQPRQGRGALGGQGSQVNRGESPFCCSATWGQIQISPALRMLEIPSLPTMTWSWTAMPSFLPASAISRVI